MQLKLNGKVTPSETENKANKQITNEPKKSPIRLSAERENNNNNNNNNEEKRKKERRKRRGAEGGGNGRNQVEIPAE